MSEKRFVIGDDNIAMFEVIDMEKEELVCECRAVDVEKVVDLLNQLNDKNEQLMEQIQILKKEVRDFLHLCDVCDIQSHLSDECEEVLNDE